MKVAVIYGSTTGNTAEVASKIAESLSALGEVGLHELGQSGLDPASEADLVLFGASTWGMGEIQDDWRGLEDLKGLDLSGKFVAVFGTGDQMGFGDTFVDALGILAGAAEKAGAKLVGKWSTEGYDYSASVAERDGVFVGLAIDQDNQPELTGERIAIWSAQVMQEVS